MYQIYLYTNLVNGKIYVGKTKQGLAKRDKQHRRDARKNSDHVIHRAMRKHGAENFTMSLVVGEIETLEEANQLETFWIGELHARDPRVGYNMTNGGEGISDPTGEVREKLSASLKKYFNGEPEKNPAFRQDTPTNEVVSRREGGTSVRDIALHFGVSDSCIYRRLNKRGTPLTRNMSNQDKEIARLYVVEKYTTTEIASLLKISSGKVHDSLLRQEIERRPQGSRPRLALKEEKRCPGCRVTKSMEEYHKNSRNIDGRGVRCRECDKAASQKYKEETKKSRQKGTFVRRFPNRKYVADRTEKKCSGCKALFSLDEFTKDKQSPDGRGSYCSECRHQKEKDRWAARKAIAAESDSDTEQTSGPSIVLPDGDSSLPSQCTAS